MLLFHYPQRHFSNASSVWCSVKLLGGKIESGGSSSKSDVLEDGKSRGLTSLLGEPFLSRVAPVDRQDPNFATPFFSDPPWTKRRVLLGSSRRCRLVTGVCKREAVPWRPRAMRQASRRRATPPTRHQNSSHVGECRSG